MGGRNGGRRFGGWRRSSAKPVRRWRVEHDWRIRHDGNGNGNWMHGLRGAGSGGKPVRNRRRAGLSRLAQTPTERATGQPPRTVTAAARGGQVHEDDDLKVIVGSHSGTEHADDREQHERITHHSSIGLPGPSQRWRTCPKAGERGNSAETEQADCEGHGRQRLSAAETGQVINGGDGAGLRSEARPERQRFPGS